MEVSFGEISGSAINGGNSNKLISFNAEMFTNPKNEQQQQKKSVNKLAFFIQTDECVSGILKVKFMFN